MLYSCKSNVDFTVGEGDADAPSSEFGAEVGIVVGVSMMTSLVGLDVSTGSAATGFGVGSSVDSSVGYAVRIAGLWDGDGVANVGFMVEGGGVDGEFCGGVVGGAIVGLLEGGGDDWIWILFGETSILRIIAVELCMDVEFVAGPSANKNHTAKTLTNENTENTMGKLTDVSWSVGTLVVVTPNSSNSQLPPLVGKYTRKLTL